MNTQPIAGQILISSHYTILVSYIFVLKTAEEGWIELGLIRNESDLVFGNEA